MNPSRLIHAGGHSFAIFQIHYDERSRNALDPCFEPYEHTELDAGFESSVIARLVSEGRHGSADYVGVFSWRFAAKIPIGTPRLLAQLADDAGAADAYAFFGRVVDRRIWLTAERKHPGILNAAALLLDRLGVWIAPAAIDAPVVYQHHVICRAHLYERFVRELLAPALSAMARKDDHELQRRLSVDAGYQDPRFPGTRLRSLFGRPHFTLHPFVAERLFSTWLALHPEIRLRQIWHGRFVEAAAVPHEPEMRRT